LLYRFADEIVTNDMPFSFLSGFFGMNFFQLGTSIMVVKVTFMGKRQETSRMRPEGVMGFWWGRQPPFWLFPLVLVAIPAGMFLWMRMREWI
jgi:hypothetical protein